MTTVDDLTDDQVLELFQNRFTTKEQRQLLRGCLRKSDKRNLFEVSRFLYEETKDTLGLYIEDVYVYLQDPLVAEDKPDLGIKPIEVRWEPNLADGPTSARLAVVDYNADCDVLVPPVRWNDRTYRFEGPAGELLGPEQSELLQFHQLNVWAIVQNLLDMYESPFALGRAIPWGTGGNRLILVPHAGYGENAYYDRHSKSLQFFYYGDPDAPKYTCLSHDIIAHEAGHAILDGIRPPYYNFTSLQTAAFHEYVADITSILSALRNNDIRKVTALETEGDLTRENIIAGLAEEFGQHVAGMKALRDANNEWTMADIEEGDSPHHCSQVLTGTVYDILIGIARRYLSEKSGASAAQALWWAARRFNRIVLQPLDLCPPVDIQFIDYARALLHNFNLYEPVDSPPAPVLRGPDTARFPRAGNLRS